MQCALYFIPIPLLQCWFLYLLGLFLLCRLCDVDRMGHAGVLNKIKTLKTSFKPWLFNIGNKSTDILVPMLYFYYFFFFARIWKAFLVLLREDECIPTGGTGVHTQWIIRRKMCLECSFSFSSSVLVLYARKVFQMNI